MAKTRGGINVQFYTQFYEYDLLYLLLWNKTFLKRVR